MLAIPPIGVKRRVRYTGGTTEYDKAKTRTSSDTPTAAREGSKAGTPRTAGVANTPSEPGPERLALLDGPATRVNGVMKPLDASRGNQGGTTADPPSL